MRTVLIITIFVLCTTVLTIPQAETAITVRCYFDEGQVETSISASDLNDFKKLLLKRFNLPVETTFALKLIAPQVIEVDANNYSYNNYVAHYHYPKFSANKSSKTSQNEQQHNDN